MKHRMTFTSLDGMPARQSRQSWSSSWSKTRVPPWSFPLSSVEKGHREFDRFTESEAAFIAERDSFYMATVSETGWPYVQHRGGPRGFLKVVDEKTLAFADYRT